MKRSLLIFSILLTISINFSGCKKSDKCDAGSGGDVTIVVYPQHHGVPINSSNNYRDSVFIKYGATDFPGISPSSYDKITIGNPNENFVNIPGMKCGQYYMYCAGFDTSAAWNTRVAGGLPINFSETSGTKNYTMPVSE